MQKYKFNTLGLFVLLLLFASCGCRINKNTDKMDKYPVNKSESDWKKELTPLQYSILRGKNTEYPFTGEYDNLFEEGTYVCAACGNELFKSKDKFNSGCGWPAFSLPFEKGSVVQKPDSSHGMMRTEILCAQCGGHLGHVFNDGPEEKGGLRYCINSGALKFIPHKVNK